MPNTLDDLHVRCFILTAATCSTGRATVMRRCCTSCNAHIWTDSHMTNLLDAQGNYTSPTIEVPGTISQILLLAKHNSPNITFALERLEGS